MGTVERDRIEYVGAEGARAMFDIYDYVGKPRGNVNI